MTQLVRLSELGLKAFEEATEPFLQAMHGLRMRFPQGTLRERLMLQDLDAVLRAETGMDSRPYQVPAPSSAAATGSNSLPYTGDRLTAVQEQQVRLYLDFVRHQSA